MTKRLLINSSERIACAAIITEGQVTDLMLQSLPSSDLTGAIIKGRVSRIMDSLNAAFIELGKEKEGFLPFSALRFLGGHPPATRIGQVLQSGQSLLVQVKTEEPNSKECELTMDVSFPGQFLIYLPYGQEIRVSQRAKRAHPKFRATLENLGLPGGWIIRSGVAEDDKIDQFEAEAQSLHSAFEDTLEKFHAEKISPVILRGPLFPWQRGLLDFGSNINEVLVLSLAAKKGVQHWCEAHTPDLAYKIHCPSPAESQRYADEIASSMDQAMERIVPLQGGGSLIIEEMETLTAIDVNSGASSSDPLTINRRAAIEISRQLRLRNIGGIIVVDFMKLKSSTAQKEILECMKNSVTDDPAGVHVYGFTKLGLMEIVRNRRGKSLKSSYKSGVTS